ncbi:hypothetical protein HRW07_04640 [Streptomyces lunaelactis]|uniref:DUF4209 domain-containing protein n=1 Tax=Streptomyces lunaelactis TaxID=1535768 RepID=UPI001585D244|nr:DUF4209 domain-containing protein [Streptomyces lunaelactis]NUL02544.1 hypothetical protein [Streptomyces lunaelactis]
MPQVEPSVLGALMEAAKDAVSYEAIAVVLAAADIDTTTAAAQQRDALLAALRLRLSGTGKAQGFTGTLPGDPLKGRSASLTEVTADQLEIWSAYAGAVSNPFVRGRLHHLLLVAGHGRKPDRARGAAAGYLDAAALLLAAPERVSGLLRATECLRWAGDLARAFNQKDLQKRVTEDMVALVDRVLADTEDKPGIADRLLEGLRVQRYDITDFAERAARRYASDVHARVGFLKLLLQEVAPGPRRTDIDTQIVSALLDAADADTGFRRHDLLTRAATEARDRGLSELRARAEMALQQTDPDSLGWTRLRRELSPPSGLSDAARAHIDAAVDLRDALWRTAHDVHPAMREQAGDAHVLEGLLRIPRTRINTAGPVQVTPSVDADDNYAVALQVLAMDFLGHLTADQLDRIQERFVPDEAELITALAHETVLPGPRARTLAHAFRYFWLGEFDAAACVALPQVEQILRQLLRPRVPIVSVAKGHTPGTVDQLGGLIRSMPAAGYPADWSRALELLLVDPDRGMNLRNNVCHGLIDTPPSTASRSSSRQRCTCSATPTAIELPRPSPSPAP